MRAFVFTDPALASYAGQVVWLDIDMEKDVNAPFRAKYTIQALPTYLLVDPDSETVIRRWVGGMTVPQVGAFLEGGGSAPAVAGGAGPPKGGEAPMAASLLAIADRLYGEAKNAEAVDAYQNALDAAPADWSQYPRTVESLMFALQMTEANEAGVKLAAEALSRLGRTLSAANVAAGGLSCALALPKDREGRADLIAGFEAQCRDFLVDTTIAMAGDDRSGLYITLLDARDNADDSTGARTVAEEWSAFLDQAAARAVTPDQRTVYDSHRLSAYMELGEPEKAIPMLEQSEKDFPHDYNPPYRLAVAYQTLKQWDDAMKEVDRALALAYGPRKVRIFMTRADILADKGSSDEARKTLQDAIAYAQTLPDKDRGESIVKSLQKKMDNLGK